VARGISFAILAAALALSAPFSAFAAGLGKLNVLSPLGQALNAEIEIVALRPGEEDTLVARVAPLDAFTAAGIEPTAMLNTMRFAVERRGNLRILRMTTTTPVNEPFVELLIELQWSGGRLVREYTFLLDPPEYKAQQQAIAAAPKPAAPKPAAPAPAPEATTPPPPVEAKPIDPAPAAPAAPVAPLIVPVPTPGPADSTAQAPSAAAPSEPAKEPAVEPAKESAPEPVREVPLKEPAPEPAQPAKEEAAKPAAELTTQHEVKKGDTLGGIARANLPPGITLNQMLIAIYRANQDAFIRENVNLVRAGRILNIPTAEEVGAVDAAEANRLVRAHMGEFREYRSRLAAVPAPADAAPGQRETPAGTITPKPEAPKPAAPGDQVRLSKVDPQKPGATTAARGDDAVARERALQEAQSRVKDLEKNVSDLQKMLEIRNQQLAELEKKAGAKPAPAAPATPAPAAPAPAAKAPEKPAAPTPPAPAAKAPEAPKPAAEAPKPAPAAPATPTPPAPVAKAPEAPKPEAPKPEAAKPEAPKPAAPAPAAKPAAPKPAAPAPEPSLIDDFLNDPVALAGLGGVIVLLLGYGFWSWRKKKAAQARFQDSVMGAAAVGAATGASLAEPTVAPPSTGGGASTPATTPPSAVAAEEVDPIAEADVYMAYGRDAQAEEILKEALQKDSSRTAVHAKLLEIYANRKDAKSFEQTALKLKGLTNGAGPDWEKAAALGRSLDPQNGLYAGAGGAAPAAAAEAPATAPTLDFDIGGAAQASAPAPDLTLDIAPKAEATGLDFDVTGVGGQKKDLSAEETLVVPGGDKTQAMDFNLDLGDSAPAPAAPAPAPAAAADPGLTFDLNLDLGGGDQKTEAAPAPDLSSISLDLGGSTDAASAPAGGDPKWQEIATKLDLAKAYEEMGDKDGARELLNEVMKDGDAAQKGTAQQLLSKLG
jgi:pilus assembly protein FimV